VRISGLYDRILLIQELYMLKHIRICYHDCYLFSCRSRSRKVASRKVADNICSQFNVSVQVSYKQTSTKSSLCPA
jgi:hypothetical protein